MNTRERIHTYHWNLTPNDPMCINCTHFHRHYRENGLPLDCGHCVFPRFKARQAYDTCEHFENKEGK